MSVTRAESNATMSSTEARSKDKYHKLRTDFRVYASVVKDGERFMTEEDLMQCFGVDKGHELYEEAQKTPAGLVPFESFVLFATLGNAPRSSLEEAFRLFDRDGDGYIDLDEFTSVIKHASKLDSFRFPPARPSTASTASTASTTTTTTTAAASSPPAAATNPTGLSRSSKSSSSLASGPSSSGGGGSSSTAVLHSAFGSLRHSTSPAGWDSVMPLAAYASSGSVYLHAPPALFSTDAAGSEPSFKERYFGKDGRCRVSYEQFAELVKDVNNRALWYKWRSMRPDANNTVSLISFGRLLVKTVHDLPPVLAKNLLAADKQVRLTYDDFVIFAEVVDNLHELEQQLQKEVQNSQTLSKAAFDEVVRSVTQRREISVSSSSSSTGNSGSSGSVVMDILFDWLDKDKNQILDAKEVAALLPLLQHQSSIHAPRPLHLWENIFLGGSAAAFAGTAVYPMDTVKSRLMNGQGSSVVGTFREIVVRQGPLALYRGLPAQLVGIMPEKALKLTLYNMLRTAMMDKTTQHATYLQEALAGTLTAVVQVSVTNPYELIKIRQQTIPGQSISECMRELGLRGMYQGVGACLLRDIPFNAMYFSSYAMLKDCLQPAEAPISPLGLMGAGLGAGLLAGALTTPADVVKTRMQTDKSGQYAGVVDCIRKMWKTGGTAEFFKGLGPRVMLIPPMFAITMTCFETFQRYFFPQTVASPGIRHLLPRHTNTDIIKVKLQKLEESLAVV